MQQSNWKSIRWRQIALVLLPIVIFLTVPLWHRLLNPTAYADVRCVMQETDGTVVKGFGRSECLNNGKQTIVLRLKED